MELRFQCLGPDHWKTEVLLAPVFQGESLHEASPLLDKAAPWLAIAPAARDFRGKKNELSLLHGHPQQNVPRVLAIGLGKAEEFTPGILREAVAAAVRRCRALEVEGLLLPEALPRAVILYKSKVIEGIIQELQHRLSAPDLSEEEEIRLASQISALNRERILIAKKLDRSIL